MFFLMKKTVATPDAETAQHIGEELCQIDDYKVVFTKTADNLKRRAIVLVKENNSWGFTLQTYGIHHKATKEVEMLTYVDYVAFDGPAHKAGMRAGDVILSINGESMENFDHTALVNRIMKCEEQMRMVVFFEDCVKKVDMHQRIIKLQKILEEKEKELLTLEEQERQIIEGLLHSSSSEYSSDEEVELRGSDVSIEVTSPEQLGESPARRASMLGNRFVQMYAPEACAATDVGAVSPTIERFPPSPSFGRKTLRRQAPVERDYVTNHERRKVSPRILRREQSFQPISSSDDESGDEGARSSDAKREPKKDGVKNAGMVVTQAEIHSVKANVEADPEEKQNFVVMETTKPATEEQVSHVDSIDDSGLQVVVNKKAAAVLGLCDMTPESQKVRKRSSSGSHGPSPVPEQNEGTKQKATPKPATENKTEESEADLMVSKKAARFLGLCEPELESKKPQRSRSANENDMVRPSPDVFAARNKKKDGHRPQSQFFVPKPGDEDGVLFQAMERGTQRRRSSQFYISLEEIEGDAQSNVDAVSKIGGAAAGKSDSEQSLEGAVKVDSGSRRKVATTSQPGVAAFPYNKRPGHALQIAKSSSLGDLYPMEEVAEGKIRYREPKFVRSQSEAVEIGFSYGSLGRRRHRKKRPKEGALVHSQSVAGDHLHHVKDNRMKHSVSHPVVQEMPGTKLRSESSAPDIASGRKVELGEVVIHEDKQSSAIVTLGTPAQRTPRSSPRSNTPTGSGSQLTRTAPWGEGELEKAIVQKTRHASAGSVLEGAGGREHATRHGVTGSEKHYEVRTKSESDLGHKDRKKHGVFVLPSGQGYSRPDLEIPVFQDSEAEVKLLRYERITEEVVPTEEKKVKKHKSRKKDRGSRSALEVEKLIQNRARSPSFLVAQKTDVSAGCVGKDNEGEGKDIPRVGSAVSKISDTKFVDEDNLSKQPNFAHVRTKTCEGPKSEELVKNSGRETEFLQTQDIPDVVEESEARVFSVDGLCIRLGELINEEDEITWL